MPSESEPFSFTEILKSIDAGQNLTGELAQKGLMSILQGDVDDTDLETFLVSLNKKGPTHQEVTGFVKAMRESCVRLHCPEGTIDLVGAGGSQMGRQAALNVSTIASFVATGAGATVCKHGNKRASSTSGSFDLLDELGISATLTPAQVESCVNEVGLGFAFARTFHPAMKHAGPIRAKLRIPTIFNTLGPLSHPAFLKRQVVGVPSAETGKMMAKVLQSTGTELGMVVTGHNGLDELSTTGPNLAHVITQEKIETTEIHPHDLGMTTTNPKEIYGGDSKDNAQIAIQVLNGETGPKSDIIVLNAAAGLVVAGIAENLVDGIERARSSIDSGAAKSKLQELQTYTQDLVPK